MILCQVEGCAAKAIKRAMCDLHYRRLMRHGDPLLVKPPGKRPPPTAETFWSKVDKAGTCWLWGAAKHEDGYGRAWWGGRLRPAHRVAYELTVGLIPEGHDLDHLCRVHECVRPDHLEPVTRKENLRRGVGAEVTRQRHAARRALTTTGGQ